MTSANTPHPPLMDRAYPLLPNINHDLDVAKNPFDAWEVIDSFKLQTDNSLDWLSCIDKVKSAGELKHAANSRTKWTVSCGSIRMMAHQTTH
mmetsp:Transcript_5155/g.9217  ORF Transcript_5155/g.9217 Transcript_5155/m.9217 type:complete len:92 (-) Transcript_5155:236-511(-)